MYMIAITGQLLNKAAHTLGLTPSELDQRIKNTAVVALQTLKITLAFWLNPYITLTALGVGLLFPEGTKMRLDRIWNVLEKRKFYAIPLLFFCTIVQLPIPLLGYSIYVGARLGSDIIHLEMNSSDDARQMPAADATC